MLTQSPRPRRRRSGLPGSGRHLPGHNAACALGSHGNPRARVPHRNSPCRFIRYPQQALRPSSNWPRSGLLGWGRLLQPLQHPMGYGPPACATTLPCKLTQDKERQQSCNAGSINRPPQRLRKKIGVASALILRGLPYFAMWRCQHSHRLEQLVILGINGKLLCKRVRRGHVCGSPTRTEWDVGWMGDRPD